MVKYKGLSDALAQLSREQRVKMSLAPYLSEKDKIRLHKKKKRKNKR